MVTFGNLHLFQESEVGRSHRENDGHLHFRWQLSSPFFFRDREGKWDCHFATDLSNIFLPHLSSVIIISQGWQTRWIKSLFFLHRWKRFFTSNKMTVIVFSCHILMTTFVTLVILKWQVELSSLFSAVKRQKSNSIGPSAPLTTSNNASQKNFLWRWLFQKKKRFRLDINCWKKSTFV